MIDVGSATVVGFLHPDAVKTDVHAELPIEPVLVDQRGSRHVAHRVDALCRKPICNAWADTPEVGDGLMPPELFPEPLLVQLRDADAVPIRGDMLRHDVHADLGKIGVGTDAGCRGDAGLPKYAADHAEHKLVSRDLIVGEIPGQIEKALVNGVHMAVIWFIHAVAR